MESIRDGVNPVNPPVAVGLVRGYRDVTGFPIPSKPAVQAAAASRGC